MRRPTIAAAALFLMALGSSAGSAQAQVGFGTGVFSDPFSAYYGFFVPQQARQASIPRVEDTVRYYSAQRQVSALTERAGLYDPIGAMGTGYDPLRAMGTNGVSRLPRSAVTGQVNLNVNGSGPPGYYNRVNQFHPNLRAGRGPNQTLSPAMQGGPGRMRTGVNMPQARPR